MVENRNPLQEKRRTEVARQAMADGKRTEMTAGIQRDVASSIFTRAEAIRLPASGAANLNSDD